MQTHDLQQGSQAWHEFRATHYGASECAAMLGLSKYTTRSELLYQKHTGISKDIDPATQARFDKGHETEALARTIIEARIGEALSPITCSDGNMSCSCDGITFDDSIAWEHKQYNDALFRNVLRGNLPEEHQPQCQQVLMITGAAELIFTCSDGTAEHEASMSVRPDPAWFERIRNGWAAFHRDLETYTPPEVVHPVVAEAVIALPALFVQIKGEVTTSNLPVFVEAADAFLRRIKTELKTDQDFADAEANVKACDTAEKGIEQAKNAITAQAADIDTIMRTMDLYKDKLRDVRLKLKKLVETEKDARKLAILQEAKNAYARHTGALHEEIKPITLQIPYPDFAGAIKGMKKLAAMQEAVDNTLRDSKMLADSTAQDIRAKLAWCKEHAAGMSMLFPDLQQIIIKPMDDFTLTITSRIDKHKADEAAKIERIREEERVKAEAAAKAKVEAEAKAEQEAKDQRAKQQLGEHQGAAPASDQVPERQSSPPITVAEVKTMLDAGPKKHRPTRMQIIEAVAQHFGITVLAADELLRSEFDQREQVAA